MVIELSSIWLLWTDCVRTSGSTKENSNSPLKGIPTSSWHPPPHRSASFYHLFSSRKGPFYFVTSSDGKEKRVAKNFLDSIELKTLGILIIWFCCYGFNTGLVLYIITSNDHTVLAQNAAISTALAASSGALSALMASAWLTERETKEPVYSLSDTLMGCLSGLVAITGCSAYIEAWASIVIGFVSGILYLVGTRLMVRFGIDDAVDAIPIHLLCGMWGCIAVGFFADPQYLTLSHPDATSAGLFFSNDGNLLACQILGILFVLGWVTATMTPFFCLLNYFGWFRSDSLEEIVGLDVSYSGLHRQNPGGAKSNNDDDEERLFYERKQELEQIRQQQRKKIRRRLLMMNLSFSRGSKSEGEHTDSL